MVANEQIDNPLWPLRLMAHLPPEGDARGGANAGTMMVRNQLPGHAYTIDAICFNRKRQHILTGDRATLRLWSLRKELKRINLLAESSDSQRTTSETDGAEALIVSLIYARERDLYICVFGGEPRSKKGGMNSFVDPAVVKVLHPSLAVLLHFSAHTAPVVAATFHQIREELCTSSTSMSIKVWSFGNRSDNELARQQRTLPPPARS